MLAISDFYTLFEIAASLNVAFIAVEYATSYTESVAKNVFKFFDKIQTSIANCRKHIDAETIERLDDVKINGHSIIPKIEGVKRESEKLSREIDNLNESLCTAVREKCQLKCLSMTCLHLFLYCLTAAFVGAYEEDNVSFVKVFWTVFFALSVIYISLSFYLGELKDRLANFFQNIRWSALSYIVLLLVAYFTSYYCVDIYYPIISIFWDRFVSITALYPFVFFLLFIGALKHYSKSITEDIKTRTTNLEKRCIALETEVKTLSTVNQLSLEVECITAPKGQGVTPIQRQLKPHAEGGVDDIQTIEHTMHIKYPHIKILSQQICSKNKIKCRCENCQTIWKQSIAAIMETGCPKCDK